MWGVKTADGDDHLYLVHCFRNDCFSSYADFKALDAKVFPFSYGRRVPFSELGPATSSSPKVEASEQGPVTIPSGMFSLWDTVAATAAAYLRDRGFDPIELERQWGVQYCVLARNVQPTIFNRIVFPIYTLRSTLQVDQPFETLLAGWQSRHIGNDVPEDVGKYMTMKGMKKSHLLYGLPQAVGTEGPLVIVEGATDVWSLRSNAVAVLGKSVSRIQQQLLVRHFPGRPIVVFFDDGAANESYLAATALRSIRQDFGDCSPVVIATPPAGRSDVGECSTEEAWASVWAALSVSASFR
jgi:hypothetical protein